MTQGEPGDKMCEAMPVDLTDPLLTKWKKSKVRNATFCAIYM